MVMLYYRKIVLYSMVLQHWHLTKYRDVSKIISIFAFRRDNLYDYNEIQ